MGTAAMLMTRVAFLGTVATALRAGSARRAPFWRRSQTTMSFSIQDTVAASDVVVFSKSWCPFCQKTKKALARGDPVHGRRARRARRRPGHPGRARRDDGPAHRALGLHQGHARRRQRRHAAGPPRRLRATHARREGVLVSLNILLP